MPIETTCQTCGQRLRVADEHAGKAARCPGCQTIYTVPQPGRTEQCSVLQPGGSPHLTAPFAAGSDRWHLRTPDGLTYGPVPKAELDQWVQQGRVTAQSQLASDANGQWVWAGTHYPQLGLPGLASTHATAAPAPNPFGELNPAAPYGYATSPYLEQHRGPVILTLAIVGIFVCDIVSIIAVIMAIIDLGKMSKGTMDPGGRGLTIAGLVIALLKIAVLGIFFGAMALSNAF